MKRALVLCGGGSRGAYEIGAWQALRELGVRCVVLSEHIESHPLARAEYVKLFGALTGRLSRADSVFSAVLARKDND